MNVAGLTLCTRYAFPPNSLSLCGPEKQTDLSWYTKNATADGGTKEILAQFKTLYPYLCLIASENKRMDPFDPTVVSAYWIGNALLSHVRKTPFIAHLDETLEIKKRINRMDREILFDKVAHGGIAHHAFHVMNIYKRTGHIPDPQTIQTMDACIINWGIVQSMNRSSVIVHSKPLQLAKDTLRFGEMKTRTISHAGEDDAVVKTIRPGDIITYHWGKLCTKITPIERNRLIKYTTLAMTYANKNK